MTASPVVVNAKPFGPARAAIVATRAYRAVRAGSPAVVRTTPNNHDAVLACVARVGLPHAETDAAGTQAVLARGMVAITRDAAPPAGADTEPDRPGGPLRVAVMGLGTVGGGLVERMALEPGRFELAGAMVRDPGKHAETFPGGLLTTDFDELMATGPRVVVELIGGLGRAGDSIRKALADGVHVVTANKALVASDGPALRDLADRHDAVLAYSAAVGGGVPMIETAVRVAREERPASVRGVMNGTTNYLLGEVASGVPFDDAVAEAQRLGYAEADPSMDIDGTDAAQKLTIIARDALGVELGFGSIEREPLDAGSAARIAEAGGTVRQVAELDTASGRASVRLAPVEPGDPLEDLPGPWNALALAGGPGGPTVVRGVGAGRWPTAESVFADLTDIAGLA